MSKIISVKNTYLLFALSFISMILHNAVYAIFKAEDAVFFILTFVFFFLFIVFIVWNTIRYIIKREPQDIWKLGWLGLIGLIGLTSEFGFFGFFGFFAFFGLRK
ncbi:MAG: hypothetical protein WC302_00985 [Candidatus Paceibacterota bacterium]|jgi:glucan phosphoethanolaminetransferase (alkaline phosphatase superfamily)